MSSEKTDKGDLCGRIPKDKREDDGISDTFPEDLICDSEALTSSEKKIMRRLLRELYGTESTSVAPLREADLEDSPVATQKKKKSIEEKEEDCYAVFVDFTDLEECYKNPRHPDLVKEDPEGKLIPKEIPGHPFRFLEVPAGVTCEVCGRDDHWRTSCPYLYDYPPGGCIENPDIYQVVCDCANPDVDPPARVCSECVDGTAFHVEPIYYASDVEFDPWIPPDGDISGNPSYIPDRDPAGTYVPDL